MRNAIAQSRRLSCIALIGSMLGLSLIGPSATVVPASPAAESNRSRVARQYIRTAWTVQDGLPQNSVNAILQTRDGYLWLGTFGGLARFDGVKFTVFNSGNTPGMKTNRILSLYEDRAGKLWIGAETGEVMLLDDGRVKTITTDDGLSGGQVWSFLEDHTGAMWMGTSRGLVRWNGEVRTFTRGDGLAGDTVWSIHEDRAGNLWLGTDGGLTEFKDGRAVTRYAQVWVRAIRPGADGKLWLGTKSGTARFDSAPVDGPQIEGFLDHQYIRALTRDREGNIWAGAFYGGTVSRWKDLHSLIEPDLIDLGPYAVAAIFPDNEGNIWFGTIGGGLIRLKQRSVKLFASEEGLPGESVQSIVDDGGDGVWATTDLGLTHLSNGEEPKVTVYTTKDGLPVNYLDTLHRDPNGTLWFGHQFGLTALKDGVFTNYSGSTGLSGGEVHSVVTDRQGKLWAGTENGLNEFRDGRFVTYSTEHGLPNNDVRFILPARDGSLWLGTVGGLSHFHDGVFSSFRFEDGLSNNYVRAIVEEADGTLWIGTYGGGLNRLRDGRITHVTVKDGLFDDFISQILEDDNGRYWMLSNRGVFHVAARELNDFADRRASSIACVSYGIADGMKSSEGNGGNQNAGWKGPGGLLWFATINGLVAIDPRQGGEVVPPVKIEEVVFDRRPMTIDQSLRVGPGTGSLEIHYTGLSFTRPEQIRFRYRMSGLEEDWVEVGTRRVAYYSHLPPGDYVFMVAAASGEGVWNESAATLRVIVVPPFWRTWWFLAIVLLVVTGIFGMAYKRRIEHLKAAHAAQEAFSKQLLESQERERQRIAAELHDGLGQSLLIIKNRAVIASSANGDPGAAREQLAEITASASQAIDEVRDIAYNLRPFQLNRFGLTKALHAIFTRFPNSSGIRFYAEIDPIDHLFLEEEEISIYRIVQESVNNIVKHSRATQARLTVRRVARQVHLRIEDDGVGFTQLTAASAESRRGGFGLVGMAERVRLLNGSYQMESAPGRGTVITISLSIADGVP
ncbi:MAG TPA: two-component regulator propeller domain-containing protein [Blastocatellia bacterium]|nr:two-component regulator propeller domain-containing protein [Blastocatellia bacterium]